MRQIDFPLLMYLAPNANVPPARQVPDCDHQEDAKHDGAQADQNCENDAKVD